MPEPSQIDDGPAPRRLSAERAALGAHAGDAGGTHYPGGIEAALESSLAQAISGFELLDQALELGDGHHVHLIGVDGSGRLVLVLLVAGEEDRSALRALDVLSFIAKHGRALVRHLDDNRLRAGLPSRVVLVAERFDERALPRLAALVPCGVEAFRLETLRSRGRESTYLERVVGPHDEVVPGVFGDNSEELLDSLDATASEVAREVSARLERLDERLERRVEGRGLAWSLEGDLLASLQFPDGSKPRAVTPGQAARTIAGERELELFLDDVVSEYLRRTESVFAADATTSTH